MQEQVPNNYNDALADTSKLSCHFKSKCLLYIVQYFKLK